MSSVFKKLIVMTMTLFICISTFASDDVSYSGYTVSEIIHSTTVLFVQHHLFKWFMNTENEWHRYEVEAENQEAQGMLPTFPFMDFESSFINYCVSTNLINKVEAREALFKSKSCGGLTVNGYNLLVLHTRILGLLMDHKHLTRKEAQEALDSCRVKN